jgi:hypothetical protein
MDRKMKKYTELFRTLITGQFIDIGCRRELALTVPLAGQNV